MSPSAHGTPSPRPAGGVCHSGDAAPLHIGLNDGGTIDFVSEEVEGGGESVEASVEHQANQSFGK